MLTRDLFGSPVRPFRQPRFSTNGSDSPNENNPSLAVNRDEPSPAFPRQYVSSPAKFQDRNILLLLGSKIPSSVPGRRSSIACAKDRKAFAPAVIFEEDAGSDEVPKDEFQQSMKRSKSMKPLSTLKGQTSGSTMRTLKRL